MADGGNSVHKGDALLVDVIHTNSGPIYEVSNSYLILDCLTFTKTTIDNLYTFYLF